MTIRWALPATLLAAAATVAGCGGSKQSQSRPPPATTAPAATTKKPKPATTNPATTTKPPRASGPGALQAEATSAAAGDIPDNQVFLTFRDPRAGWSMKYPEGWAQSGSGLSITFRDKNNIVRVAVERGALPSPKEAKAELRDAALRSGPQSTTVSGSPAVKLVYTTRSPPNAVTGKRVLLVVDRYYLAHQGMRSVVDLGTPEGVDNVDAYRLMIESFRWR